MKKKLFFAASLAAVVFVVGCATSIPPGAERGPNGTMAYEVLVEASSPGVRIEANGQYVGEAPVQMKIFGDPDGSFHDFGSPYYEVRALPVATNQFVQVQAFRTGQMFSGEDKIPSRIYFDMNQPPVYAPNPGYSGYAYPPPYYGPGYYYAPQPYYYGPTFRFGFGVGRSHYYGGHGYSGYHGRSHHSDHSSGLPGLPKPPSLPGLPRPPR